MHIPSIVVITPKHGFAFVWSGFRTRNLGRGGSLGAAAARASWFVVFLPATMIAVGELCCDEVVVNKISLQHFLYYSTSISISDLLYPRGSSPHLSAVASARNSLRISALTLATSVLATEQQHARRPLVEVAGSTLVTRHRQNDPQLLLLPCDQAARHSYPASTTAWRNGS